MSKQEVVLRTNYWSGVSRKGKQKRWKTSNDAFGRVGWVTEGPNPVQPKNHQGAHQEENETALVQLLHLERKHGKRYLVSYIVRARETLLKSLEGESRV